MKKALVAMSGGVDSSVAALLTQQAGYDACGCTMVLHDFSASAERAEKTCCAQSDVEDARSVARRLAMPFWAFNFKDEFYEKVVLPFISDYENARTPNPCINCNRYLKFAKLYQRAKELGCDKIVTGHYARIEEKDGVFYLKKALDETKDQSYVLYSLTQDNLAHTLFPLGDLTKSQVRRIAEENGFVNARKPDSQDICFVPDGNYARVIEEVTHKTYPPGPFLSLTGEVLGEHRGIIRYTVGQRKGLGVSGGNPLYVVRVDPEKNAVILGKNEDLFRTVFFCRDLSWTISAPDAPMEACVKTRYRQKEVPARITPLESGKVKVETSVPLRAITPGQAAVFYQEDTVLGGGIIEAPDKETLL